MLKLHILDEFSPLKSVIVHDARNAIDLTIENVEHPEAKPILRDKVIAQTAQFHQLLRQFEIALYQPISQPEAFCQVFTRDPCFVVRDTLFISHLRDGYRQPEITGLENICNIVDKAIPLATPEGVIEGGDVMVLHQGQLVLVGLGQCSNPVGVQQLMCHLQAMGVEVIQILHRALHLDCCLAPLPDGEALYSPHHLPQSSLDILKPLFQNLVPLDQEEASLYLAANLLWLDHHTVVSHQAALKTNHLLRAKGYQVHGLDFSDLIGMWGSFRCAACPLERG